METVIIILLCLIAAAFAASPFFFKKEEWKTDVVDKRLERFRSDKEIFYQAIKDVDFEYAEGKLTERDHQELRDYYKEKAIQTVKEIDAIEETSADKTGDSGQG